MNLQRKWILRLKKTPGFANKGNTAGTTWFRKELQAAASQMFPSSTGTSNLQMLSGETWWYWTCAQLEIWTNASWDLTWEKQYMVGLVGLVKARPRKKNNAPDDILDILMYEPYYYDKIARHTDMPMWAALKQGKISENECNSWKYH